MKPFEGGCNEACDKGMETQRASALNWGRLIAESRPGISEFWREALIGDTFLRTTGESLQSPVIPIVSSLSSSAIMERVHIEEDMTLLHMSVDPGGGDRTVHGLEGGPPDAGFPSASQHGGDGPWWQSSRVGDNPWLGTPGQATESAWSGLSETPWNAMGMPHDPLGGIWPPWPLTPPFQAAPGDEIAMVDEGDEGGKPKVNPVPQDTLKNTCCCCVNSVTVKKGTAGSGKRATNAFTIVIQLLHKGSPGKTCACTLSWWEHTSRPYPGHSGLDWVNLVQVHGKKTYGEVESDAAVKAGALTPDGKKADDKVLFQQIGQWMANYADRASKDSFPCWPEPRLVSITDSPSALGARELFIQVCACSCRKDCDCKKPQVCVQIHQKVEMDKKGDLVGTINFNYTDKDDKQVRDISASPPGGWPRPDAGC